MDMGNLGNMQWRKKMLMIVGAAAGNLINELVSFIVFSVLDIVDFLLCYVYKVVDFVVEAEWKPCYCSSSAKEAISNGGANILLSELQGEGTREYYSKKIVCQLTSSSSTKLQLEEISDTLYTRSSLMSEVVSKTTLNRSLKLIDKINLNASSSSSSPSSPAADQTTNKLIKKRGGGGGGGGGRSSTFTINSTIIEMLQGKIGGGGGGGRGQQSHPIPRWSDCDCHTCNSWSSSTKDALYYKAEGPIDHVEEDVIFIHGFISSSAFWTETLFPNLSKYAKTRYRLFAFDLLGFGRSPKPNESLYTIREHIEMIETSVLQPNRVKSFHIVAHSLGCILALALAVKHPASIKSLTLLAPPYFPAPKGEQATQYVMRRVAPRRVWPVIAFGASMACWYEHISRTICLLICKNHRIWDFLTKLLTRNRLRTYLIEGFCCHTHNAAWHTLHNIICGTASRMEGYLDFVQNNLKCSVNIFHGRNDELIPVECSYNVQSRIGRARVKIIDNKDHITIVVGRQKEFARELEDIWKNNNQS